MLSNQVKVIKIEDNCNAIYNNLLLEIIYVTDLELKDILDERVKDKDTLDLLYENGIYIKDEVIDKKALDALKENLEQKNGLLDIMYLILTNNCNLACRYCFLDNNPNNEHAIAKTMTKDIAFKAIDKFANYLKDNYMNSGTIIFYGGEPFIEKELFFECVRYARKYDIKWLYSVITNGTLVDDEIIEFCKEYDINIGLSLDGPQDIHDKNRVYRLNEKPTYGKCMETKSKLDRNNNSYGLSMVASDEFINDFEKVTKWLESNHEGDIYYNLMHFSEYKESNKEYAYKVADFLIKTYEYVEKNNLLFSEGRLQRQIDSFIGNKFVFSDCGAVGCHQVAVLPSGNLTICHGDSVDSKHWIGNIDTIKFEDIKNTKEGRDFKNYATLYDNKYIDCEAIYICGGGCPHQSGNICNSRFERDENFCIYVKEVLKWLLKRGYKYSINK